MRKKNIINGYKSFCEFENDLASIKDLSKLEEQNKLFEIVYKVSGLYVQSKYGYYLTGDLYTMMLNSIMVHLIQTTNIDCLYSINNLYAKECLKIFDGNFDIDFRSYFYSYENEHDLEMKRTNLNQIISLRKSIGILENQLSDDTESDEFSFTSVEEIEGELNFITDLSDDIQRFWLNIIIYKIMRLYGYKLILSSDVFDSINLIVSEFKNNVNNREYYSDKNKNRSYIDKVITSLLDSYPKMASSTLDLFYNIGIETVENELSLKAKHLTFEELQELENSGIKYMQNKINHEDNKSYIKK